MKSNSQMQKFHEPMNPLIKALHELGGSGSIEEISQKVAELSDLPEDLLNTHTCTSICKVRNRLFTRFNIEKKGRPVIYIP